MTNPEDQAWVMRGTEEPDSIGYFADESDRLKRLRDEATKAFKARSLRDMIDDARQIVMTDEEIDDQAASFAFGNASMANHDVTKDLVVTVNLKVLGLPILNGVRLFMQECEQHSGWNEEYMRGVQETAAEIARLVSDQLGQRP